MVLFRDLENTQKRVGRDNDVLVDLLLVVMPAKFIVKFVRLSVAGHSRRLLVLRVELTLTQRPQWYQELFLLVKDSL